MKKLLYIFSIIMAGSLVSCDLTNVTDITPPNQLSEETVITDIGSAEKVLIGAYAQLHSFDMLVNQPGITGSMGPLFPALRVVLPICSFMRMLSATTITCLQAFTPTGIISSTSAVILSRKQND